MGTVVLTVGTVFPGLRSQAFGQSGHIVYLRNICGGNSREMFFFSCRCWFEFLSHESVSIRHWLDPRDPLAEGKGLGGGGGEMLARVVWTMGTVVRTVGAAFPGFGSQAFWSTRICDLHA